MSTKISVISPVYRAENIVQELVSRITTHIKAITDNYEIILVEDGSPDNSWIEIEKQCRINDKVVGIKLSRNFGQHYALTAGLQECTGDYAIVMDCDLQDDPVYFKNLWQKAQEGYEIVFTQKEKRKHSFFKNITAYFFTQVFNYLADYQNTRTDVGAYSMLSRKVIQAYLTVKDVRRHYLPIIRDLGFQSGYIDIEHQKRFEGNSTYNLKKLLLHAIDGITFNSTKLLWLSIKFGFTLCMFSFLWAIYIIYTYFFKNVPPGYPSIMVMLLLSTGIILISIGIAGIYIGNIFLQVKNRPLYFIDKRVN